MEEETQDKDTSCVSGTSGDGGETGAGGASVALLNSNYNELVIARARARRALNHAEELSDSESEDSGVTTPELVAAFESICFGDESAREEKELEEELQRQEVAKQAIIAKDQAMRENERMKELARQDMERENAEREKEAIEQREELAKELERDDEEMEENERARLHAISQLSLYLSESENENDTTPELGEDEVEKEEVNGEDEVDPIAF
jgi:hypothetical protein